MSGRQANLLASVLLIVLAAYVFVESRAFSARAALLPVLLAGFLLVLAVAQLVANANPRASASAARARPFADVPLLYLGLVVVALVLFGLGANAIGFYESAFIFLAVVTWLMSPDLRGVRRYIVPLVFAAGFDAFLYVAFKLVLNIPTPRGILI